MKTSGSRGGERSVLLAVTSPITVAAFLRPLVRGLVADGWQVTVASGAGPELDSFGVDEGVETLALPLSRTPSAFEDLRCLRRLVRTLRGTRRDLVVAATPKASLLTLLAARLTTVPVRVHLGWGMRSETLTGWRRTALRLLEAVPVWCSTTTIANSPSLAAELRRLPGVSADRVRVLGAGSSHGVDIERFRPREEPRSSDRPSIGFVGRINSDKGVGELLDAVEILFARGVDFELLVYGSEEDAQLGQRLRSLSATTNQVEYRGTAEPSSIYPHIDVLCLPSLREGFPNVVLEAAACAIPAVATLATGVCDSVVNGETGVLVPPHDAPALANALEMVLGDDMLRRRLGVAARERVLAYFREDLVVEDFVDCLSSEVGRGRRRRTARSAP